MDTGQEVLLHNHSVQQHQQQQQQVPPSPPLILSQNEHNSSFDENNSFNFPDPARSNLFFVRFFAGVLYPINAVKLCFTERYILMSVVEATIVGLLLYLIVAFGVACGYLTTIAMWSKPNDRQWHWWKRFLPYNLFGLWVVVIIVWCMFYISILLLVLLVPFRAAMDASCRKLSILVERRMRHEQVRLRDIVFGIDESGSGSGEAPPRCCTWEWIVKWCKSYAWRIVHGYFNQFKSLLKKYVKRYSTRLLTFVITNVVTFMLGFLVPGVGFIVSSILFFVRLFLEMGLTGLDVIMDRRSLGFFEVQRTLWNNLSLIVGLGFGLVLVALMPFGILLLYPVAVISATRLYVHLEAHERTGRSDEFWDLPLCFAVSFHHENPCFVRLIPRSKRKVRSILRRKREQAEYQQQQMRELGEMQDQLAEEEITLREN